MFNLYCYIPTPINRNKRPNLNYIKLANYIIGNYLDNENIVIYESTVYPGLTEEYCVPMLEKISKMKFRNEKEFFKY